VAYFWSLGQGGNKNHGKTMGNPWDMWDEM